MAQLDRMQRHGDNHKTSPRGLTVEQVLRGGVSKWSPTSSSPTFWKDHDPEEDYGHHHKKSVLAKVKEKAKKFRHSLSKKKHSEDGNTTPSWGVSLDEDDDEEDAEYLGAPMYESELAPEGYKETARQHPRAVHFVSEKHVLACSVNLGAADHQQEKEKPKMAENVTTAQKLSPLDETHPIASKFKGLSVSAPAGSQSVSGEAAPQPMSCRWPAPQTCSSPGGSTRQTGSAPAAPHSGNASFGEQIWDKGVSVKEYLIHKIEPGEDERALSQVISETLSTPRRIPGDLGVVEKVREAVTSLLRNESCKYTPAISATSHTQISADNALSTAKNSPSSHAHLPISTNAHEVGEGENHGRILQAK